MKNFPDTNIKSTEINNNNDKNDDLKQLEHVNNLSNINDEENESYESDDIQEESLNELENESVSKKYIRNNI